MTDLQGPFRTRDGLSEGLTPRALRGNTFDRSVWGVRASPSTDGVAWRDEYVRLARLYSKRMPPTACLSHISAAILLGIPLPLGLERRPMFDFAVPAPARAPHADGIKGHSLTLASHQVIETDGLAHTSAERTWCDLASVLTTENLVAAGDFLIHWRNPISSRLALFDTVRRFPGQRGLKRMMIALPRLHERAESPPESIVRFHLVESGLPEPEVNFAIELPGGPDARADLAYPEFRTLIEYQGDYHRTAPDQWRRDMTRRARLESQGWFVVEINADDLRDPVELASRIRSVLTSRGWRP